MDNNGKMIISNEKAFSSFSHSAVSEKECGYKEFRASVTSHLIRKSVFSKVNRILSYLCTQSLYNLNVKDNLKWKISMLHVPHALLSVFSVK